MSWTPIAISLGAILGALSRYYITLFWLQKRGDRFPYGTLFVNLVGAFLMGLFAFLVTHYDLSLPAQKLLVVGFLGSFTTFSSYILDTVNLFRRGSYWLALLYWLGSAIGGFLCVEAGLWLA